MNKLTKAENLLHDAIGLIAEAKAEANPDHTDFHLVADFVNQRCHLITGAVTKFSDFYASFNKWSGYALSKTNVKRALKRLVPVGTYTANVLCVGNLALDPPAGTDFPFIQEGKRIRRAD